MNEYTLIGKNVAQVDGRANGRSQISDALS
jgi:hypothetical protein